jgi:hypothetical protein
MHGEGLFRWEDGKTYEGQFDYDDMTGLGIMNYQNRDIDFGDYVLGELCGKGNKWLNYREF